MQVAKMKFAVFPGSEKLDMGQKQAAVLCSSEAQARHMVRFWAPYGYYEPVPSPEACTHCGEDPTGIDHVCSGTEVWAHQPSCASLNSSDLCSCSGLRRPLSYAGFKTPPCDHNYSYAVVQVGRCIKCGACD